MLHRYFSQFLAYCQLADFSIRSIQALTARLSEFDTFLKIQRIRSVKKITYQRAVAQTGIPNPVKNSRPDFVTQNI